MHASMHVVMYAWYDARDSMHVNMYACKLTQVWQRCLWCSNLSRMLANECNDYPSWSLLQLSVIMGLDDTKP